MNSITEWRAISDRIRGFVDATTVFLDANGMQNPDSYGTRRKHLLPAARGIYESVKQFAARHGPALPLTARETLARFSELGQGVLTDTNLDNSEALLAAAATLSGFRAELQFQLADLSALILRTTERAFLHLQRQIVADPDHQRKWQEAFEEGEPACERLGSVHLLQHGIWAFKVSAEGGRTDLVFREPLKDLEAVADAADALVLTEWKVVNSAGELASKIQEARMQAELYAAGVLGGVELAGYRYLVMVSEDLLHMPEDEDGNDVQYRHRNVAVSPSTPSVVARRRDP